MKRYKLWALDVPDLHPEGFRPRLGGMRLFDGGDGNGGDGGGDGTTQGIDAPAAASSSADASTGFSFSGSDFGGQGEFNDPFSAYDPATGGFTTTPGWTPGEYESGQPITVKDLAELPDDDDAAFRNISEYVSELFDRGPTTPTAPASTTTNPVGAPNVVSTPVSGGYLTDSFGNPVTSTSFGLPGEYASPAPQLPADTLTAAAAARDMTVNQLREVVDAEQQSGAPLATTGLSYDTLQALQNAGLGDLLDISPTQTVNHALAAKAAHDYLNENIASIVGAVGGPTAGAVVGAVQQLKAIEEGRMTPGQMLAGLGLGALAGAVGVPTSVASNIAQGRIGDAAGSLATGAATGLLGSQLDLGPFSGLAAGAIMKETGLGPFIGSNVDRAVTGVVPDQHWDLLNTVGGGIDQVLKDMGLPMYRDAEYRGEPITPSLPGTPSYGGLYDSGDGGITDLGPSPAPTTPAPTPAPEPPKQEQTITLEPRRALQPEIYQGRYGPLMRYNYVPVGG